MDSIRKMGTLLLLAVHKLSDFGQRRMASLSTKIKKSLSRNTKVFLSVALIAWYSYLLYTSSEWSGDHVDIACVHVLTFLPAVGFLSSMYSEIFLATAIQLLSKYGLWRLLVYLAFLFAFSSTFVAIFLDWSALTAGRKVVEFFHSRFENNVLRVNEARMFGNQLTYRQLNAGLTHAEKLFRYPMEDVQMTCLVYVYGLPDGKPYTDQVEWRYNGVPLAHMTDRHTHTVSFRELPQDHHYLDVPLHKLKIKNVPRDDPILDKTLRKLGLTAYELTSTLSIQLLQTTEFGSYTCHVIDGVEFELPVNEREYTKTGDSTDFRKPPPKKPTKKTSSINQCECQPEPKFFYQDLHRIHAEYRLIMMKKKQQQISAPPSSILFFETSYWHLSADEDVQMDYTVNGLSYYDLCTAGSFQGCSALQRLLSYLISDRKLVWWYIHLLPFLFGKRNDLFGHQFTTGHCLCENSFGRHKVKYIRNYYNKTTERNELVEITHPHELLIRPPTQNTSSFLANFFNFAPIHFLPLTEYLPENAYDRGLIKDFAVVCSIFLEFIDGVFISLGMLILFFYVLFSYGMLRWVGNVSKRLFLEGSMGYLYTAKKATRFMLQRVRNDRAADKAKRFNIYICHADSVLDSSILEQRVLPLLEKDLGITCCVRDRDLPPNELELNVLSAGIQDSERFIIFLSNDLLTDACRETEISMIMESAWEIHPKDMCVLVIRLDDCEVPVYLTDFMIHDWTAANLNLDDKLLRLVRWVAPHGEEQGTTLRSPLDAWMIAILTLLVAALLLAGFLLLV